MSKASEWVAQCKSGPVITAPRPAFAVRLRENPRWWQNSHKEIAAVLYDDKPLLLLHEGLLTEEQGLALGRWLLDTFGDLES